MIFVKIYLGDTMKNFLDKLDKYESAVNSLTEMVEFESSFDTPLDKLNEAIRDSIIKKFEDSFELAQKTIKEYLEKEGYEEISSPRKVLKQAFEINLIKNEARNSTAHKYDEEQAIFYEDVIKKKYFNELKNLLGVLKNEK